MGPFRVYQPKTCLVCGDGAKNEVPDLHIDHLDKSGLLTR